MWLHDRAAPERGLVLASAATLAVRSSVTLLLWYSCGHVFDDEWPTSRKTTSWRTSGEEDATINV